MSSKFVPYPTLDDKDFYEKIYKKKEFYDTKPPPLDSPDNQSNETISKLFPKDKDFKLQSGQSFLRNFISEATPYKGVLAFHGTGTGKCMKWGTKLLMYSGEIKEVQDLKVGDILMGDFSQKNIVTSLARGKDDMYEIIQESGESYAVNSEHILCLQREKPTMEEISLENNVVYYSVEYYDVYTRKIKCRIFNDKKEALHFRKNIIENTENVLEITVKDYLELPRKDKSFLKGYSTQVEFPQKEIEADPYLLGKWLVNKKLKSDNLITTIEKYNLEHNLHIPLEYKANTREIRLKLLSGLSIFKKNSYKIILDKDDLLGDILYLLRSLGFKIKKEKVNNKTVIHGIDADINSSLKPLTTKIKVKHIGVDNYYGFTLTGNGRYLLKDFTVTHNTCASIVIAERFHERVEKTGQKTIIIADPSIQNEFKKTIFNFEKEGMKKNPKQIVQCTGKTYALADHLKYMPSQKQEMYVSRMIKEFYDIFSRDGLKNKLQREISWNAKESSLRSEQIEKIKEIYSDRVIIVDEAHNRVDTAGQPDKFPTALKMIVQHAENVRLILMSATPMVNSPEDILVPINILRINDRRPVLDKRSIFKPNEDFTEGGEKLLRAGAKGYISYVRGGDPPRFPYKLIPSMSSVPSPKYFFNGDKIPENEKIKYTKVIKCEMNFFQFNTYNASLKSEIHSKMGGLLPGPSQAGNIVFPSPDEKVGVFGSSGYGNTSSNDHALVETRDSRGNTIYKYSSFSEGFLLRENISKYSAKFASVFDNIVSSTGISFVYSRFIPGGLTPLALMLEENGFEPAVITGKENKMMYSKTKKPSICYKCGKVKHDSKDHVWAPAKYAILTGSLDLTKVEFAKISGYINRKENMNGQLVKVLLGSKVSGEGIDFKRIRQVNILEPWHNQATIDQIEGRAIRNGSHKDLPPEQRNVEIFKYCIVPPSKLKNKNIREIETIDERDYRVSEDKDKKIKKVEYILKEIAIDCLFQKENNLRNIRRTIKLENSRGQIVNYVTGDAPYSRECDYKKTCNYKCEWEPGKKIDINRSTYGDEFSDLDIEKARVLLYEMYKENPIIDADLIFYNIKKKDPNLEDIYVYLALESLMKKDGDHSLKDQYGREGYLVERGNYYIFQPRSLADKNAPLIYKKTPLQTKQREIPFSYSDIQDMNKSKKILKFDGKEIFESKVGYFSEITKITEIYVKNKSYNDILMRMTFSMLSEKEELALLKYIVLEKKLTEFGKKVLEYYRNNNNIYEDKLLAIMVGEKCLQYGKSKSGKKKEGKWGICDPNVEAQMMSILRNDNYKLLWEKVPSEQKIREDEKIMRGDYLFIINQLNLRSKYIGVVEKKEEGDAKYFKILDFTNRSEINSVSKRKEVRGRVCQSLMVQKLRTILDDLEKEVKKLAMKNVKNSNLGSKKVSRQNTCILIEFLLRLLNKETDKVWFYDGKFDLDKN